jgi:glycosyltransferase involved in cell wall biosynthesis
MNNLKLIYFTSSYPYGIGEVWKTNELNVFRNYFNEIVVLPETYGGNPSNPKRLPEGVQLAGPIFQNAPLPSSKKEFFRALTHRKSFLFFKEFFLKKVYSSKSRFTTWLTATIHAMDLLKNERIKDVLKNASTDTVLYFYWGKGSCGFLPFINNQLFKKTVVKMHRFDLFEDENNGYIAYRKQLLKKITMAAPSSQNGKDHLDKLYPGLTAKSMVFRCGTLASGQFSKPSTDAVFQLFSCSYLVPVKRVEIIIKALAALQFEFHWHHIGDGPERQNLEELLALYHLEHKVTFHGKMNSDDVFQFYIDHPVDIFINVSASEGVPFSIMEAFSAGIPVFATNVGGTGEIVNDTVGKIMEKDLQPSVLAQYITDYWQIPFEKQIEIRQNAFNQYEKMCNSNTLSEIMANYLIQ